MTDWRARVTERLPVITGEPDRDRDIRDELVQHCLDREADLVRDGASPEDAAGRVTAELDAVIASRAALRRAAAPAPVRNRPAMSAAVRSIPQDLRHVLRLLRRAPAYSALVVLTLALAIGAAAIILTVIQQVLWRPLPYEDPDRVVMIWERRPRGDDRNVVASGNYLDWRARASSFEAMTAVQGPFDISYTGGSEPILLRAVLSDPSFAEVLRIRAVAGRLFDSPVAAGPAEVLITERAWQERFNRDPAAIGRALLLNGRSATVIGVLPASFDALFGDIDVVYPKVFTDADRAERRSHNYVVFARLRHGTDLAAANAEMGALVTSLVREHPQDLTGWGVNVVSAHADRVRLVRPLLLVLVAAVAAVLLIACGNLANLQLVRAARRAQEVAVRVAIGASRARVASLILAESGILCACGGAAGLALAALALGPIVAAAPIAIPFAATIHLDGWTIAAIVAVTAGCAILIGLVPAVQLARAQSMAGVHGARIGSTAGQRRVRHFMIAAQCALSLVLMIGSALLVRSMTNLAAVPHGFDPVDLVAIRLDLPSARYPDTAAHARFYEQVIAEIRALPGVAAAAGTTGQPASPDATTFSFAIEGRPSANPTGREDPVPLQAVTPGYFETMRIPVLAGRVFTGADRGGTAPVAVINRALAARHWPNESPVGHRFAFRQGQPPFEIIGVVGDTYDAGLDRPAPPTIYVAFAQRLDTWRWMSWQTLLIRTPDAVAVPGVRRIVKRHDADLPLIEVSTVEAWYAAATATRRFAMQLIGAFSGLALLLAAIGIYGVLSCAIADRRQEIGIRLALGASSRALLATVTRSSLVFAGLGVAAGLLLAALVTRFLSALLFDVPPTDPLTFAAAAAAVLGVAGAAAWLPSRRALRVDPLSILRS